MTRYRCPQCRSTFSRATLHPCFRQKKRQINLDLWFLLASKISQRRAALYLDVHRTTVSRRLIFLGQQARLEHARMLAQCVRKRGRFKRVQFDEMESFEHTRCKPLSIPVVVSEGSRFILSLGVAQMPAKGPLAEISRRKYGPRHDERIPALRSSLESARRFISDEPPVVFTSDSHPFYPPLLAQHYPKADHLRVLSRRAAVVGQGEMKRGGFDPIFSLNQTAAMSRDGISRLVRKTWGTTKRRERLLDHLYLYAVWHNQQILERTERQERHLAQKRLT